ncbi:3'-5' exonuclease [Chryseobacterium populi]|uniref:DNA polymerase III epsilon subunit-like 3'-5' exonuclease n=1 Tax=Chryseobacterium populi TaxID=1144316 RepID=J3CCG9_9FLAO|nr:3'-5' exonuclease [Chryseobacterium populi]EJL68834.1 DNA polymerase III epsilon subunit-like 3'-5' exonuclease [Chryseobacterium populi]
MKKYLLFIDTETTAIPKRWNVPYSETDNWPSAVQLSWILYDETGSEIKRENFYINAEDLKISAKSFRVHGISKEFLSRNGENRRVVLEKLSEDIQQYHPLITGHFTEFDIHTLSCDYYRADLENPFQQSHFYCTMLKSKDYVLNAEADYFRLPQLYDFLFNEKMQPAHDAMIDVEMTAKCFFEIRSRGEISDNELQNIHDEIECKLKFLTGKMK